MIQLFGMNVAAAAGSQPALGRGQQGNCSARPGARSAGGDLPCFLDQVVRELGSLFSPDQGCFSLHEKPGFWLNSKSIQSSVGQGTLPEKLPVFLPLWSVLFCSLVMRCLPSPLLTSAPNLFGKKSIVFKC